MAFSKNRRLADIVADTSGNINVPTQSDSDNDTSAASTAFVHSHVNALIDSAPGTLNTLNEIAAALNDDPTFTTTVNNAIATKLPLAGGTMTGDLILKSDGGDDVINVVHSGNTVKLVSIGQSSDNSGNGIIQLKRNNGQLHSQIHSHGSTYFNGGNVGIGFASGTPDGQLHIKGSTNKTLKLDPTFSSGTYTTLAFARNGTDKWRIFHKSDDSYLSFYNDAQTAHQLSLASNGDVGIGTTDTLAPLHIEGNTNEYADAPLLYFGTTSTANAAVRDWAIGPADSQYGNFHIFRGTSTGANAIGSTGQVFTIKSNGNVGIMNDNPQVQFAVATSTTSKNGIEFSLGSSQHYLQSYNRDTSAYADLKIDAKDLKFGADGAERLRIHNGQVSSSDEDVVYTADGVGVRSTHYANFEGQSWSSTDNNVNVRKALHEAAYGSYNVNFEPGPYSNGTYYVLAGKKANTANSYIKFKIALNKATHLKLTQTVTNSADATSRVTSIHYSFDDENYTQAVSAAFGAGSETTTATLNFNSIGTQSIGGVFTGNIYVRMRFYLGSSIHETLIGWKTIKIESKAEDMQLLNAGGPQYGPVEAAMFRLHNNTAIVNNNAGYCDLRLHDNSGYMNPEIFEVDTTGNYGIHIKRDGKVFVSANQDIITAGSTSYATLRIYRSPANDANNRVMAYQLITNTNGQWNSIHNSASFDVNAGDRVQFYIIAGNITNLDTTSWSQYNIMWMDSQHSGSDNRAVATYQENAHYDFIG